MTSVGPICVIHSRGHLYIDLMSYTADQGSLLRGPPYVIHNEVVISSLERVPVASSYSVFISSLNMLSLFHARPHGVVCAGLWSRGEPTTMALISGPGVRHSGLGGGSVGGRRGGGAWVGGGGGGGLVH